MEKEEKQVADEKRWEEKKDLEIQRKRESRKTIKKINHIVNFQHLEVFYVVSEPGDGTRYDYIVLRDYDIFKFMGANNNFKYPRAINYYEMPDFDNEESINELAKLEDCNPWTLKECLRTIKDLRIGNF